MSLSAEDYVKKAVRYYKALQYKNVLVVCELAIQLDPQCARAYHGRGLALTQLKRYEEALEDYQKACELGSDNARLLADMGDYFCLLDDYERGGSFYRKAIELDKAFVPIYESKAQNLIDKAFKFSSDYSQRIRAINVLKQVLLFYPSHERAEYYLSCMQITLPNITTYFSQGKGVSYLVKYPHPSTCSCLLCTGKVAFPPDFFY